MNNNCNQIISAGLMKFSNQLNVTRHDIENFVFQAPLLLLNNKNLNQDEKKYCIKNIESRIPTKMGGGQTLTDESHIPWLDSKRGEIDWNFWDRYKILLYQKHFSPNVVGQIDTVTDEILDLLQNPNSPGRWERRGLVVGHVQSGKTANYTGLICKAYDSGYRLVIILAGLLNSLRTQTQERIDEGVIGRNSAIKLNDVGLDEKLMGVGKIDSSNFPITITTVDSDFNLAYAGQNQHALESYSKPIVFVLKKNVKMIENLIGWLKTNNFSLEEYPLLLIDDEADHASINTNKSELDPTKTNRRIRELLDLFEKKIYLGYTATPFANIFIDPDTPEDMENDLFPEHFIKTLDAPSNYFGAKKIYIDKEIDCIRTIDDHKDILPVHHKIDDFPQFLPSSLKIAIKTFILVCTIRDLRGESKKHNSMLINVSRFTGIQSCIRNLVHNEISDIRKSIKNNYALNQNEALLNSTIKSIKTIFEVEFPYLEYKWAEVQRFLHKAASKIKTVEVNGSPNAEKTLDYTERSYPNGRSVIAVGGISLSRGITLEGLSTTYFLRNSYAYDTLMQMGRWFGYRNNYEDLCRIWMTSQSEGYYRYIANATEELRIEFQKMMNAVPKKTPKDFGLAVRDHPEALTVTARNKMYSAKDVIRSLDLAGRTI